jgi:hypothetical protein
LFYHKMSSVITSNVTSGFIDLATFDEIEKYMYGGPDATAYFVRETRKSTWFTQVPVVLSNAAGSPGFNQDWSVNISRAGDYLLQTWLRLSTPTVQLKTTSSLGSIRWTRNFMHNLIRECSITFNDLVAARFDSYQLDFWAAFTTPASKQAGYDAMIGNIPSLIEPVGPGGTLASEVLNLPLPFFYGRDSGVALPTAALPYNEMRINFSFRDWTELLVAQVPVAMSTSKLYVPVPVSSTGTGPQSIQIPSSGADLITLPTLSSRCYVWANYAIVSNDERKRMACAPRDILIEQVQTAPIQTWNPITNAYPSYDIRFSHAIKVLFFAVRNKTCWSAWSNYTCWSQYVTRDATDTSKLYLVPFESLEPFNNDFEVENGGGPSVGGYPYPATGGSPDPILDTSLIYENTARLSNMGSDYFSLVNPWFNAPTIPDKAGFHSYSYSLDFICLDPMGSTNYGKLTNVSINPTASQASKDAAVVSATSSTSLNQQYQFIVTAVNNNIIRISGGALGFPVL